MRFFLQGLHESFWLFAFWVGLRVWELNFEVAPLPAILLPIFVFLALASVAFFFGRRLQKRAPLDRRHLFGALGLLVVGAILWEAGLTVYLGGSAGLRAMLTLRFVVGIAVQSACVLLAGWRLRALSRRGVPEGLAQGQP